MIHKERHSRQKHLKTILGHNMFVHKRSHNSIHQFVREQPLVKLSQPWFVYFLKRTALFQLEFQFRKETLKHLCAFLSKNLKSALTGFISQALKHLFSQDTSCSLTKTFSMKKSFSCIHVRSCLELPFKIRVLAKLFTYSDSDMRSW